MCEKNGKLPVIVCSRGEEWGRKVLPPAWEILSAGGGLLDAVELAARVAELDPEDTSVGYGGLPNEEGVVQLDAACMDGETHRTGAVACLEGIRTPSGVARLVMERCDQTFLAGAGAQRFAIAHGFRIEDLLTEKARLKWLRWREGGKKGKKGLPTGTINIFGIDRRGNLAGITTTSGLAYKAPGRVGDSPVIGAGLYVDNDAGAAGAIGRGEEVIRICGSFHVVSLMRERVDPASACLEACERIVEIYRRQRRSPDFPDFPDFNVQFTAVNKKGEVGCAAIRGSKEKPPAASFLHNGGFSVIEGRFLIANRKTGKTP